MRTTVNIPDSLLKEAKRKALDEGRTVTDFIVEGLRNSVSRGLPRMVLPVSVQSGGLKPGVAWDRLLSADPEGERHR
jgi:hypothetical protein